MLWGESLKYPLPPSLGEALRASCSVSAPENGHFKVVPREQITGKPWSEVGRAPSCRVDKSPRAPSPGPTTCCLPGDPKDMPSGSPAGSCLLVIGKAWRQASPGVGARPQLACPPARLAPWQCPRWSGPALGRGMGTTAHPHVGSQQGQEAATGSGLLPWKGGPESGRCHPVLGGGRARGPLRPVAGKAGAMQPLECSEARLRPGGSCGGPGHCPCCPGWKAPGWDVTPATRAPREGGHRVTAHET